MRFLLMMATLSTAVGIAATPAFAKQATKPPRAAVCALCHGPNGVSDTSSYPTIAGQPVSYLVHALKAYRDGQRDNLTMGSQAKSLSNTQIRALAGYYHRQSTPLTRSGR